MRRVVEAIPNSHVFALLQVSLRWSELDTWLKKELYPAALRGDTLVMDYLSPTGRMRLMYNKKDVLTEVKRFLPFVKDVTLGKRRVMANQVKESGSKHVVPLNVPVRAEGISDPELRQKYVRYVRIRRAWQEWKNS